jgi:hypothetical protein
MRFNDIKQVKVTPVSNGKNVKAAMNVEISFTLGNLLSSWLFTSFSILTDPHRVVINIVTGNGIDNITNKDNFHCDYSNQSKFNLIYRTL